MKSLGFDIGTSSICGVVIDENQAIIDVDSCDNEYEISSLPFEKKQDPKRIISKSLNIINNFLQKYPDIVSIGLTGQMHGILYVDRNGDAVSSLYTWEDKRGDIPYIENKTYAESLSDIFGQRLSTGYGAVTHFYNLINGIVPADACSICTISDYLGLVITKGNKPILDPTMAASIGLYSAEEEDFNRPLIHRSGLEESFFPQVRSSNEIGKTMSGIPVYSSLGDNQASFLGSTAGKNGAVLINLGTGGQISIVSDKLFSAKGIEPRPYLDNKWLIVGAPLCGGESYAILERFFREICKILTGKEEPVYSIINSLLENNKPPDDIPKFCTQFNGTRDNPCSRGSISGLSSSNFTPLHFIYGMLYGMAYDMYAYYEIYLEHGGKPAQSLIGSGNGLRKNPALCRVFSEVFGMDIQLSTKQEEAACGAAEYALKLKNRE